MKMSKLYLLVMSQGPLMLHRIEISSVPGGEAEKKLKCLLLPNGRGSDFCYFHRRQGEGSENQLCEQESGVGESYSGRLSRSAAAGKMRALQGP